MSHTMEREISQSVISKITGKKTTDVTPQVAPVAPLQPPQKK